MNVSDEKGALFRIRELSYPEKQTIDYYQKQIKMVTGMVAEKADMINEKSGSATPSRRYESTSVEIEIDPLTMGKWNKYEFQTSKFSKYYKVSCVLVNTQAYTAVFLKSFIIPIHDTNLD